MVIRMLVAIGLVGTMLSAALAQPPITRPGGGANPPSTNGNQRPTVTKQQWPRSDRQVGSRRQDGSRKKVAEKSLAVRIDPNISRPSRSWYLGVYEVRAPKGVRLVQIVQGTPADRYGLEEGDYIFDVGGYVVGEHNGTYYPLAMAMDFGAGPNGWAELLVWNKRTFNTETVWVQFQRR